MKTLILSLSALSFLTACSSGSSGSAGGVSPVLPTVPSNPITNSQLAAVPLNQLLTSTVCLVENGSSSAKFYFTKLPSNQIALEKDSFMGNTTCSANLFSTEKITYSALSFSIFSDPSFDLLSLSLVSQELTFYNQSDVNAMNSASLFGYTDWSANNPKRVDCRKPDPSGTQRPCAGTASTEKLRYVNSNLNFGQYLFQ